jgi:hypothetical protein
LSTAKAQFVTHSTCPIHYIGQASVYQPSANVGGFVVQRIRLERIQMENKEGKQERLITINNLCGSFSVIVEKHYGDPNATELLTIIKQLAEECRAYLTA